MRDGMYYKQHTAEYDQSGVNIAKTSIQLVDKQGAILTEKENNRVLDENTIYTDLVDISYLVIAQEKRVFDKNHNHLRGLLRAEIF